MSVSLEHRKHTPVRSNEGEAAGLWRARREKQVARPTRRDTELGVGKNLGASRQVCTLSSETCVLPALARFFWSLS